VSRTYSRFLVAVALAVAFEQLRLELSSFSNAHDGSQAWAQAPGDPTAMQGQGAGSPPLAPGVNPYVPNSYGPTPPTTPMAVTRPSSWPGGNQNSNPNGAAPSTAPGGMPTGVNRPVTGPPMATSAPPPSVAPAKPASEPPYDPAMIVARVGSEVIQANEVLPNVYKSISFAIKENAEQFAQMTEDVKKEQLHQMQRVYMQRSLVDLIRIKLLLSELRSKVPPEGLAKNEERMRKDFNDNKIKRMLVEYKASSIIDLESKLRTNGSSLDAQRSCYTDQGLAIAWLHQQVKNEPQPTHEELLAYYRENTPKWEVPSRARWEHLMVKFLNFNSKAEAYRAIARWGNEILAGRPFAEVAKAHSQDFSSEEGGLNDWTTQGSLRSVQVDEMLFRLPPGQLSPIVEDEDGFHIVRVLEREDARRTPFTEVQDQIKDQLYDGNKEKHMLEYVDKLRDRVPVWTIFDDDPKSVANAGGGVTR